METMRQRKEGILHAIKILGYLNFVLFFIGFLNSKGGNDLLAWFVPVTLFLSIVVTLAYTVGFRLLPLDGHRRVYWSNFRPFVWHVVICFGFVGGMFLISFFGGGST